MSPSVGNFVHDLVEMAKAMEELPLVQQELSRVRAESEARGESIAAREDSILRLKSEIEALQGRVRDAEVSRDDAELRFLELDEKAGKVLRLVDAIAGSAKDTRELLSPPQPKPVAEPKQEAFQSNDDLYKIATEHPDRNVRTHANKELSTRLGEDADSRPEQHVNPYANEPMPKPAEGQSEASPTVSSMEPQSQPAPTAEHQDTAPTTTSDDVGYHNEPTKWTPDWYTWAQRMDSKYGPHFWPERPSEAAAS